MKPLLFYSQNNKKIILAPSGQKGFTLIEVIISIVILGILGVFMSNGIARIMEGYLFTKDNAATALKSQVALARIVKEFHSIDGVSSGTKTAITYSYNRDGSSVSGRTLSWAGSAAAPLLLGGNILADNISDFEITYYKHYDDSGKDKWKTDKKMIGVVLELRGANNEISSFSTRIMPRNL